MNKQNEDNTLYAHLSKTSYVEVKKYSKLYTHTNKNRAKKKTKTVLQSYIRVHLNEKNITDKMLYTLCEKIHIPLGETCGYIHISGSTYSSYMKSIKTIVRYGHILGDNMFTLFIQTRKKKTHSERRKYSKSYTPRVISVIIDL